jgi:hypothetical protein
MSSSSLNLTSAQIKTLRSVLSRSILQKNQFTFPEKDFDFVKYLFDQNIVVKATSYCKEILLPRTSSVKGEQPLSNRSILLAAMESLDSFTYAKALAIEHLLNSMLGFPNLLADSRRLTIALQEANSIYRTSLLDVFQVVNRTIERFNENIDLKRPLFSSFAIMFEELHDTGIFCFPPRVTDKKGILRDLAIEAKTTLERVKAGKFISLQKGRELTINLENNLKSIADEAAEYWINEKMIKHYVRDTLIPHAIINGYIDPNTTTDYLGGIWQFTYDAHEINDMLVVPDLLFHQPKSVGKQWIGFKDIFAELSQSEIQPNHIPYLSHTFAQQQSQIEPLNRGYDPFSELIVHPYIRIAYGSEYVIRLLIPFLRAHQISVEDARKWIENSLFAIDPGYGLPAQSLASTLNSCIDNLSKKINSADEKLIFELNEKYHNILGAKFSSITKAIQRPFLSRNKSERFDSFDVREGLTRCLLEGLIQPRSEWLEEQEVEQKMFKCAFQVQDYEKRKKKDEVILATACENLLDSVEKLYTRAEQIKIDMLAIRIWEVTSISVPALLNNLPPLALFQAKRASQLILPLSIHAMNELLNEESKNYIAEALGCITNSSLNERSI